MHIFREYTSVLYVFFIFKSWRNLNVLFTMQKVGIADSYKIRYEDRSYKMCMLEEIHQTENYNRISLMTYFAAIKLQVNIFLLNIFSTF